MVIALIRKSLAIALLSVGICACTNAQQEPVSPDLITEISIADVPTSVKSLVRETNADFVMKEVLKKERGERIYYDVEGELQDGSEIEFDILMGASGPEIVEIQRDIDWSTVPESAQALVIKANTEGNSITRVIESTQTDGAIIYEVFIEGNRSDPQFEVWSKDETIKLLSSRWQH